MNALRRKSSGTRIVPHRGNCWAWLWRKLMARCHGHNVIVWQLPNLKKKKDEEENLYENTSSQKHTKFVNLVGIVFLLVYATFWAVRLIRFVSGKMMSSVFSCLCVISTPSAAQRLQLLQQMDVSFQMKASLLSSIEITMLFSFVGWQLCCHQHYIMLSPLKWPRRSV